MATMEIMLVDDHEGFRSVLRGFLEGHPYVKVVAEAANGIQAIEEAVRVEPDIIFMDIAMPGVDGFAATREIKRVLPGVAVVFISLHDDQLYRLRARDSGGDAFISKTSLPGNLPDILRDLQDKIQHSSQTDPKASRPVHRDRVIG